MEFGGAEQLHEIREKVRLGFSGVWGIRGGVWGGGSVWGLDFIWGWGLGSCLGLMGSVWVWWVWGGLGCWGVSGLGFGYAKHSF